QHPESARMVRSLNPDFLQIRVKRGLTPRRLQPIFRSGEATSSTRGEHLHRSCPAETCLSSLRYAIMPGGIAYVPLVFRSHQSPEALPTVYGPPEETSMPIYKAPVEDTLFLLNDVFHIERFVNLPGFADASPDVVEAILSAAGK